MTEEINNGNDIQSSDNVRSASSDSADVHSESSRVDEQKLRLDSALPHPADVPAEAVTRTIEDADLGASKPVPVAKPEPKHTVEHAIVKACGHSIDLRHPPTQANCEDCWTAFFTLAVDTPSIHKILVEQGRTGLERMVGKKFVKHFGKFLQNRLNAFTPEEIAKVEPTIEGSIMSVKEEINAVSNLQTSQER
jgi:hypothetical protein